MTAWMILSVVQERSARTVPVLQKTVTVLMTHSAGEVKSVRIVLV